MKSNIEFNRTKQIGSSVFHTSENGEYFKKTDENNAELLKKEYKNLIRVREDADLKNINFIRPIELSEDGLISEYINAENLIRNPSPCLYREFGKVLREFHESGYVHSHLQFNDVLYDGSEFYLTDLPFLNESSAVYDVVVPKIGLDSFKIKRPWSWRLYTRCFDEFVRGYGQVEHFDLDQAYDEAFNDRVNNLMGADAGLRRNLKGFLLNILRRSGVIGPI